MTEPKDIKFLEPRFVLKAYGNNPDAGSWISQEATPRLMADVDGDGRADIIGFQEHATVVHFSNGESFGQPLVVHGHFSHKPHGWTSQNIVPRVVGDINGDGKADIVGFAAGGVWAMTSAGRGFNPAYLAIESYCVAHNWSVQSLFPRMLGDVNGDGWADIVGFGRGGVFVSLAIVDYSKRHEVKFAAPNFVLPTFGIDQTWESQDRYPRFLADVDGDKRADIIGFGNGAIFVSFSNGVGFTDPQAFSEYFTSNGGYSWNDLDQNGKSLYGRTVADINGDGRADIVGFYAWGTTVMTSNGRSFNPPYIANYEFSYGTWGIPNAQPRMLADVNGDRKADIVGFKADGVHVSLVQSISTAALDVQACERFSPNIEAKCMEKVYNKAIKQLDESRMNVKAIQNSKKELIQSYTDYAGAVVHLQMSRAE
jgi:hypothetical protein